MASPECKLSHIGHFKRLIISCLGGWQDMYTEHDVNITLPPPPLPLRGKVHFGKSGKCSLRQVRQMFTSARPEINHFGKSGKQSEHIMQALHVDDLGTRRTPQPHSRHVVGYPSDSMRLDGFRRKRFVSECQLHHLRRHSVQ